MRGVWVGLAMLLASPALAEISAWCGGGFTGGGSGTRIDDQGQVFRVERRTFAAPPIVTPLGQDSAALARWRAMLAASGFAESARRNPGNMTCSLAADGVVENWPGLGPPPGAPGQVFQELRGWSSP